MIIGVQFYDMHLHEYQGKTYSYICNENVSVGSNVRVPNGRGGTVVGRVKRVGITEAELEVSPRSLREVISVEPNPAPEADYHEVIIPEKQLSLADICDSDPEPQEEPTKSLIVVKQLPIIEENLQNVKSEIVETVKQALALTVTDDTVKDVKKIRADLNGRFKQLEDLRKNVKNQIMAPYDAFEKVYKECVTDIFTPADKALKEKVDAVENGLKDAKREKVKRYFEEYRDSLGLNPDFIKFESCGIKITLSDSERSLKAWAKDYIDSVNVDLEAIKGMEFSDEIYAEYRVTKQLNTAVAAVNERHARIEREKQLRQQREEEEARRQAELAEAEAKAKAAAHAAPIAPPAKSVEEPEPPQEEIFVEFRVYGTIDKLRALKKFLNEGNYRYDNI